MKRGKDTTRPLYLISVVSRILDVHPQTIRMYEREGFISPKRVNRQRLYSDEDLERLNFIISLTKDLGVNKAGVDIILRMTNKIKALQDEIREIMKFLEDDVKMDFEKRIRRIFSEE